MNINEMTDIELRFWNRTIRTETCFQWKGETMKNGYGRMQFHGHRILAHRLSFMLNVGHIDDGFVIHHECGNKGCVNPDHLKLVSPSENTKEFENQRYREH